MEDEKYVFFQDVREKKVTGYSARKQRSHCGKGGRVKFPSDYLTKKELKNMSGECKSYRLNEPMKWREFKAMPDDIKVTYINLLRKKYAVPSRHLAKMFGISEWSVSQELKRLDLAVGKGRHSREFPFDRDGFYEWAFGLPKTDECQSVQEEVEDERPADYVEYTHYEVPTEEAEQEVVEEERQFDSLEEIAPIEFVREEKTPDPLLEKLNRRVCAIPKTGSLTFTGDATSIVNTLVNLLGDAKVLLSVNWDVVED